MTNPIRATVTLNSITAFNPCPEGLDTLLEHFGDVDPDLSVPLLAGLESNPVVDVIWALRAVDQDISAVLPLIAADFAESVLHIFEERFPDDKRPRQAIEAARAFTRGEISRRALVDVIVQAEAAYANAAAGAAASAANAAANAANAAYANAANAARAAAANAANAASSRWAERQKQIEVLKRYFTL